LEGSGSEREERCTSTCTRRRGGWDLRWGDVGGWFLVYFLEGGIAILLAMRVTDRI